jgi:hypothetical protein
LLALVRSGVPQTDLPVRTGAAYLLENRPDWISPGNEIDAANAMEAALAVGSRWRDISRELAHLLTWASEREPWAHATDLASDSLDESSKAPFIASSLIGIVWDTLKAEMPLLLEGLASVADTEDLPFSPSAQLHETVLLDCIRDLHQIIDQNVRTREPLVARESPSGAVIDALRQWRSRRAELLRIEGQVRDYTRNPSGGWAELETVRDAIDRLGRACSGEGWQDVAARLDEIARRAT